jgi:hypothetical protein
MLDVYVGKLGGIEAGYSTIEIITNGYKLEVMRGTISNFNG